ncbi:Cell division cycle protein 48 homolog AF_1297 [Olea europaea subsp. europaea]|uniref:Cell division cycle protein 48 homolog AF_1297 n=1 Tax=Olea europaea subsp. europaea TaxID=158383 RepID=A0A8S0Q9U2_OLEEU|nr:Cell division cycle protein 48 homolog AF_1297 [Olea europaea subsp. europaea]
MDGGGRKNFGRRGGGASGGRAGGRGGHGGGRGRGRAPQGSQYQTRFSSIGSTGRRFRRIKVVLVGLKSTHRRLRGRGATGQNNQIRAREVVSEFKGRHSSQCRSVWGLILREERGLEDPGAHLPLLHHLLSLKLSFSLSAPLSHLPLISNP